VQHEIFSKRFFSSFLVDVFFPSTSQVRVEKKFEQFSQEFRDGKRQGSVLSNQTLDSLCNDEKEVWRTIRKELEDIGITVAAFEANKAFIFEWFTNAVANGAFEEQSLDDAGAQLDLSDEQQNGNSYLIARLLGCHHLMPFSRRRRNSLSKTI
jgi:hypothetical protein